MTGSTSWADRRLFGQDALSGQSRQNALFEGGVFGWDFPDVSAVWADIVALWKQFQRYHVNVRLAAVQTHPERSRQCGRIYVPGAKLDLRVTG